MMTALGLMAALCGLHDANGQPSLAERKVQEIFEQDRKLQETGNRNSSFIEVVRDPPVMPGVPDRLRLEAKWQSGNKCGPVALYFLLRMNGIAASLDDIAAKIPPNPKGASLAELQDAAASYSLKTKVIKIGPEQLASLPRPFIIHWNVSTRKEGDDAVDHFDVVTGVDEKGAFVIDTADSMLKFIENRSINSHLSGYALVVDGFGDYRTIGLSILLGLLVSATGVVAVAGWVRRPTAPEAA